MGEITDIKARVERLSREEQSELLSWLIELDHARWDEQIAQDHKSGKLDALIDEARRDRAAGKAREL